MISISKIPSVLALLLLFITGCRQAVNKVETKSDNKYAEHFSIEKTDTCTIVNIINPWIGADNVSYQYFLINNAAGKKMPDHLNLIEVPLNNVICMSTTHIAYIDLLGKTESITGVSGKQFVYNKSVLNNPDIADVGYDSGINYELIISLNPDLILLYGVGSDITGINRKLNEMGIKTMIIAEYLEPSSLGKAEWIKVFGELYFMSDSAEIKFNMIDKEYNDYKKLAENTTEKPTVFMGSPYNGVWHVSGGKTNLPGIINDAGGDYIWNDYSDQEVYPMNCESVLIKASEADFWINSGSFLNKEQILFADRRLDKLKAYREDKIYNNNNRSNDTGGNDFYESGAVNPHLILKDLLSIFHPELLPDHKLYYYKKF